MPTHSEPQSLIGQGIDAVETPAMVVDLDLLEANLQQMAGYFRGRPCRLRPHFKSHKCVELARRQLAAGNACGITCAKLSEAEQLVAGGIDDVLIANQVIGSGKAARLAALNQMATVRCAVDSTVGVMQLAEEAAKQRTTIPVLVEVDIGMQRCGVAAGKASLDLVRTVCDQPALRFDGLQGYEGHLVGIVDRCQRETKTRAAIERLIETRRQIESAGIPVPIVSGGSSSTYDITGTIDGVDEMQCGSYALMDWNYRQLRDEFQIARWIVASVISSNPSAVVVDVGLKGVGCDFGAPQVDGHLDATARYTAEEHIPFDGIRAKVGDRLRLIPSHGCTTSALHRRMWITRNRVVVDVWDLEGAGCLE